MLFEKLSTFPITRRFRLHIVTRKQYLWATFHVSRYRTSNLASNFLLQIGFKVFHWFTAVVAFRFDGVGHNLLRNLINSGNQLLSQRLLDGFDCRLLNLGFCLLPVHFVFCDSVFDVRLEIEFSYKEP